MHILWNRSRNAEGDPPCAKASPVVMIDCDNETLDRCWGDGTENNGWGTHALH